METQHQMFKDSVNKLSAAIDQIKFDGSLSPMACDKIRSDIYQARETISTMAGVNPDPTGKFKIALDSANLLEKAVNAVDDRKHLV